MLILSWTYLTLLLLAALTAAWRYQSLDKASRVICLLIWLGLLTESLGLLSARIWHSNYVIYNISFFFYFLLMLGYFRASNRIFNKWHGYFYLLPGLLLLGLVSMLSLGYKDTLNALFLLLKCSAVIGLTLYSLRCLYQQQPNMSTWPNRVHFWLPLILLFQQSTAICIWISYQPLIQVNPHTNLLIGGALLLINSLTYGAFTLVIFLYPQLDPTYV